MKKNEKISIDDTTYSRLIKDSQFLDYFVNNVDTILENSEYIYSYALQVCLEIPKVEKAIMKNIPTVIKKTQFREDTMSFLTPQNIKKNIEYFFAKNELETDINYAVIINNVKNRGGLNENKVLNIIIKNIDNIIRDSGQYLPITLYEVSEYLDKASKEQIEEVDKSLVRNINNILGSNAKGEYDLNFFEKMVNFKQEIKKHGIEFFVNFPICNSIEEIQKFSQEIFGEFNEKFLCVMKFGYHNLEKAKLIEIIIKELLDKSNLEFDTKNIVKKGRGCYAEAYQIGNYVLKVGCKRSYEKIPNHPRILQPIIRKKFLNEDSKPNDRYNEDFIEVQNVVDTNCWKNMSEEEIDNVLFEIYCDMRKDDIVWFDISKENAGKLIKDNMPNFYYIDIDGVKKDIRPSEEATGLIRTN